MSYQFLRELLSRRPFDPFAVHLSNGEVHVVRSPECAVLTKSRLVIADLKKDRLMITSLLHIANVEMLNPPSKV